MPVRHRVMPCREVLNRTSISRLIDSMLGFFRVFGGCHRRTLAGAEHGRHYHDRGYELLPPGIPVHCWTSSLTLEEKDPRPLFPTNFRHEATWITCFFFGYDDHYQQDDKIDDTLFFSSDFRRTNRAVFTKVPVVLNEARVLG